MGSSWDTEEAAARAYDGAAGPLQLPVNRRLADAAADTATGATAGSTRGDALATRADAAPTPSVPSAWPNGSLPSGSWPNGVRWNERAKMWKAEYVVGPP